MPLILSTDLVGCCLSVVFSALYEMALDGGLIFSHLMDVVCRESRICVEIPPIDGFSPCVLYWDKFRRM